MSTGLISLAAGVLIGLMYAVLKVRSPAPPALALEPATPPTVPAAALPAAVSSNSSVGSAP